MAQFRATISGAKGSTSRLGHKTTGLRATVNGWHVGAEVIIRYDDQAQKDVVEVYRTGGSSPRKTSELLATFTD